MKQKMSKQQSTAPTTLPMTIPAMAPPLKLEEEELPTGAERPLLPGTREEEVGLLLPPAVDDEVG